MTTGGLKRAAIGGAGLALALCAGTALAQTGAGDGRSYLSWPGKAADAPASPPPAAPRRATAPQVSPSRVAPSQVSPSQVSSSQAAPTPAAAPEPPPPQPTARLDAAGPRFYSLHEAYGLAPDAAAATSPPAPAP